MIALLLANPNAGRVRGSAGLARLERALAEAGLSVERVHARDAASVPAALRAALVGRDPAETRVVVAGGDGSIRATLPVLMGAGFPLAILPVGSVNVLARELGLPRSLTDAARVAATGCMRAIDLGLANGTPFALMAGLGFDAAVVHTVAPQLKNLVGSVAYVTRGLSVLAAYRPSRFRIAADEETFETEAWLAVVANAPRYTYRWRLSPDAALDDGWLDLCLFQSTSPLEMAGQVVAVLRGRHADHPRVRHLRACHFRFACDPPVCAQLDGDPEGMTPVEVHVAPRALRVVVPVH